MLLVNSITLSASLIPVLIPYTTLNSQAARNNISGDCGSSTSPPLRYT